MINICSVKKIQCLKDLISINYRIYGFLYNLRFKNAYFQNSALLVTLCLQVILYLIQYNLELSIGGQPVRRLEQTGTYAIELRKK